MLDATTNFIKFIMNQGFKLSMLGGFEASLHGQPVAGFAYSKMRALLAYLVVEREQDHYREILASLLWGNADSITARGNLRRTLSLLRGILESPASAPLFVADKHTIRFIPNGYFDVLDFTGRMPSVSEHPAARQEDHDERMLALYRGEFLSGFSVPDSPEFEHWLLVQRESMHRRALALLEKIFNTHERTGNHGKALQYALRHTELDPWNEEAHRRVMRLHASSNQKGAALAQYETCCRLLKKELDVLPSEKTRQLAECIRRDALLEPHESSVAFPHNFHKSESSPRSLQNRLIDSHRVAAPIGHVAERRQVTVLYCELTPTGIDDPDEAMDLLKLPQAHCVEIIQQHSGYIVQTHGGGLLAYFGYPKASENAARIAVQAALTLTTMTAQGVEIRAGIHTGMVIAGGELSMPDTSGRTSKLATQLLRHASGDGVLISSSTFALVHGYFNCANMGEHTLSGMSQPLGIFKVQDESGARTRLDAASQLTPFSGRRTEISSLMAMWKTSTQGKQSSVLIQGEAGIGKSRLLHTLKGRLAAQPHQIRELYCLPEFTQSPFYPLIAMIGNILNFQSGDTAKAKSSKLLVYLETHFPTLASEAIPLLATLLALPTAEKYQQHNTSPQNQKKRINHILLEILYSLAHRQPTLLIVEDLHWIDPSTMELLTLFIEKKRDAAILTVLTARPEFIPPWQIKLLPLSPLPVHEVTKMIVSLRTDISAEIIIKIAQRADGVPLFVEEMIKLSASDSLTAIPATLHDLLSARIDRMGKEKHSAQLAATLGREFDVNVLRHIAACDQASLAQNLSALVEAGLILKTDETGYRFKHALIQEAIYQSQTKADRQAAHQRVAQTLRDDFADITSSRPELLAQHLEAGGEMLPAIECWVSAGQRATKNSALHEAMQHFNAAERLLMTLPAGQDRDKRELPILQGLFPVLNAVKGYGSKEAVKASARIAALSAQHGDNPELFFAEWAQIINAIAATGSRDLPEAGRRLLIAAQDDPLKKVAALHLVTNAAFWQGDFTASRIYGEHSIALYHPDLSSTQLTIFGTELSINSASYMFNALYFLGHPEKAHKCCQSTVKQARELGNPNTLAQALCYAAALHRWSNQPAEALLTSAESIAIAKEHGLLMLKTCSEMTHGWADVAHGREKEGMLELNSCIAAMRLALGGLSVIFLSSLAEAHIYLKQYDEALVVIAEAQAEAAITGDGHFLAELHRLKGVCLLALSPSNAEHAESCFTQALTLSRQQQAKTLELRAATSMAQLWQQHGKQKDARHVLEQVYNWFTEGFDTFDLQQASKLLRELG